jgi:peptidylprolyl isomerase
VKAGQTATVDYVGVSFSTGQEFDASWDRGEPFPFPLGGGQVIQGWDQGVEGMKVGGRRELVIPPDLGYGPQGSPPAIAPNETLVFVIDLKKIG